MGKKIGYVRVSTEDQSMDRQLDGLEMDTVFKEVASAKTMNRPKLLEMIAYCREGDEIYVHSLDRVGRNVDHIRQIVKQITIKKCSIRFIKENLTFTGEDSPLSMLMLNLLASFAEFERSLMLERQREGIAIAKKAGKYKGRPSKWNEQIGQKIIDFLNFGATKAEVCRKLGISVPTIYKYMKKFGVEKNLYGDTYVIKKEKPKVKNGVAV